MNEYVITFKYDDEGYSRHITSESEDDAVGIAFARTRGMLKEFDAKKVTDLDIKEIGKKDRRIDPVEHPGRTFSAPSWTAQPVSGNLNISPSWVTQPTTTTADVNPGTETATTTYVDEDVPAPFVRPSQIIPDELTYFDTPRPNGQMAQSNAMQEYHRQLNQAMERLDNSPRIQTLRMIPTDRYIDPSNRT